MEFILPQSVLTSDQKAVQSNSVAVQKALQSWVKQLLSIIVQPYAPKAEGSLGGRAMGMLKGRAKACVMRWGDPTGLLLRPSLPARYGLLNHYVNCSLNLKVGSSQPASQLWKQLTMSCSFFPVTSWQMSSFCCLWILWSLLQCIIWRIFLIHNVALCGRFATCRLSAAPFFPIFCSSSLHNLTWKHNLSIISLQMIHRLMVFLSQWKCRLASLSAPLLLPSLDSLSESRSPKILSKPSIYFLG